MPHLDELLGVATVAAAGLFVATALQPLPNVPREAAAPAASDTRVTSALRERDATPIVRLPTIEVVARRSNARTSS